MGMTWTDGNEQKLDTRQRLVAMEEGTWHGEEGFRAKLKVG